MNTEQTSAGGSAAARSSWRSYLQQGLDWYAPRQNAMVKWLLFFCLFFALLSYTALFKNMESGLDQAVSTILDILRNLIYLVLLLNVIYELVRRRLSFWLTIVFLAVSGVCLLVVRTMYPLKAALVTLSCISLSEKQVFKTYWQALLVIFVGTIALAALGLAPNVLLDEDRVRYSMGFDWVSTPGILLFFLILLADVRHLRIRSQLEVLLFVLLFCVLYLFTKARFLFLLCGLYCLWIAARRAWNLARPGQMAAVGRRWLDHAWVEWLLILTPVILAVFSIVVILVYNPENAFLARIDSMLSGRLSIAKNAWNQYGVHLFGKNITWIGYGLGVTIQGDYNYVDNSYLQFLLNYGLLLWLMLLGGLCLLMRRFVIHSQGRNISALLMVLIMGLIEPYLINPFFNPFFALLFPAADTLILPFELKHPVLPASWRDRFHLTSQVQAQSETETASLRTVQSDPKRAADPTEKTDV